MSKRLLLAIAVLALALPASVALRPGCAWATAGKKVNCPAVMAEVKAGKKTKDIASDLKISTSSVYRCKKKEAAAAASSTSTASAASTKAAPAAATSPASK